jgi:hypothetical protein
MSEDQASIVTSTLSARERRAASATEVRSALEVAQLGDFEDPDNEQEVVLTLDALAFWQEEDFDHDLAVECIQWLDQVRSP